MLFTVVVVAAAAAAVVVVVVVVVGLPCFYLSGFRNSLQRHLFRTTNAVRQRNDKGFAVNHTINPFEQGCSRDGWSG